MHFKYFVLSCYTEIASLRHTDQSAGLIGDRYENEIYMLDFKF